MADSDHGIAADGGRGAIWMNVVWPKPGRLSVTYAWKARVFKREPQAKGAVITYETTTRRRRYRYHEPLIQLTPARRFTPAG